MSQHYITCRRHEIFFQRLAAYLSSLQPKAEHSQFPRPARKVAKAPSPPSPFHPYRPSTRPFQRDPSIWGLHHPFSIALGHPPSLITGSFRSVAYRPVSSTPKHHETCRQGLDTGRYQSHPSIQGARRSSTSANWRAFSPYSYELSFTLTTFVFHVLP